jgi:hypothetical protein
MIRHHGMATMRPPFQGPFFLNIFPSFLGKRLPSFHLVEKLSELSRPISASSETRAAPHPGGGGGGSFFPSLKKRLSQPLGTRAADRGGGEGKGMSTSIFSARLLLLLVLLIFIT